MINFIKNLFKKKQVILPNLSEKECQEIFGNYKKITIKQLSEPNILIDIYGDHIERTPITSSNNIENSVIWEKQEINEFLTRRFLRRE